LPLSAYWKQAELTLSAISGQWLFFSIADVEHGYAPESGHSPSETPQRA